MKKTIKKMNEYGYDIEIKEVRFSSTQPNHYSHYAIYIHLPLAFEKVKTHNLFCDFLGGVTYEEKLENALCIGFDTGTLENPKISMKKIHETIKNIAAKAKEIQYKIDLCENAEKHMLKNGASVASISAHGFKFSDGTESVPQNDEIVKLFTLKRELEHVNKIKGMSINKSSMVLDPEQVVWLNILSSKVDLLIVPFPVLVALREQGMRYDFDNVVAFNATKETQRSKPDEKIVDLDNWSW